MANHDSLDVDVRRGKHGHKKGAIENKGSRVNTVPPVP